MSKKEVCNAYDDKYSLVSMAFVNISHMKKNDFIKHAFDTIFDLIIEAEKGTFYELIDGRYTPVYSRGYDPKILEKLSFDVEDAFIDFESASDQDIDAHEVIINKRDVSRFDDGTIEAFKSLGTYENFISLFSPVKIGSKKVGLICLEN